MCLGKNKIEIKNLKPFNIKKSSNIKFLSQKYSRFFSKPNKSSVSVIILSNFSRVF